MSKKHKWKQGNSNQTLKGKGFMISYLSPKTNLTGIKLFNADDEQAETAIVVDGKYYILNGDFRKEYEAAIEKGLIACIQIFKAHPELKSSWSN